MPNKPLNHSTYTTPIVTPDSSHLILNRELGLIKFYERVLAKATCKATPILEKLNYLCIVSKNCDELFEVRIARLLKLAHEEPSKILPDGISVQDALSLIRQAIVILYANIYAVYEGLLPQLNHHGITMLKKTQWNKAQQEYLKNYFISELKPIITPISINPKHPFPRIANKNLHFAIELYGNHQHHEYLLNSNQSIDSISSHPYALFEDEYTVYPEQYIPRKNAIQGKHAQIGTNHKDNHNHQQGTIAIALVPRHLPRVIQLPAHLATKNHDCFVFLQDIISSYIDEFFYGAWVRGCYPFKVTRATDFTLKAGEKNIRYAVTQEVYNRKFAACSRLELDISSGTPWQSTIDILLKQFNISNKDLYLTNGPVNLSRLNDISSMITIPSDHLRYARFTAGLPKELATNKDIFAAMDEGDILIHTPYQSFDPVVELTKKASIDNDVLAIKMIVYRTGHDSQLVQNLISAAKLGKQVVASIELFARFDEENNIYLANLLEQAGAHVVYGVMGYKVHAKMLLIVKRDRKSGKLKRYVHLGSGNYHQETAKLYTDFGILTTNAAIVSDVETIFAQITGIGHGSALKKIYQAPFMLHNLILSHIERETANALAGKPAKIIAKMNSLLETQTIHALYKASCAGVKIDLIVRGACALRPQLPQISQNIQVRSIVGRFLEHSRIFYFYNDGKEDVYLSSADWMKRNFFRRIEACIPVLDKNIKKRIIREGLEIHLKDNRDAWIMNSNGDYSLVKKDRGKRTISAQETLIKQLAVSNSVTT